MKSIVSSRRRYKSDHTAKYETDYCAGQDNVKIWGMDIHNPVFGISASLILLFIMLFSYGFWLYYKNKKPPVKIPRGTFIFQRKIRAFLLGFLLEVRLHSLLD